MSEEYSLCLRCCMAYQWQRYYRLIADRTMESSMCVDLLEHPESVALVPFFGNLTVLQAVDDLRGEGYSFPGWCNSE